MHCTSSSCSNDSDSNRNFNHLFRSTIADADLLVCMDKGSMAPAREATVFWLSVSAFSVWGLYVFRFADCSYCCQFQARAPLMSARWALASFVCDLGAVRHGYVDQQ